MKPAAIFGVVVVAATMALGGGYWLGKSRGPEGSVAAPRSPDAPAPPARKLLYYRNPMGLPDCGLHNTTCTGNQDLGTVTLDMERQEFTRWQNKLVSAGVKVGP